MKPVILKNRMTGEQFVCNDIRTDKQVIDGIEFLLVRKQESPRTFLMRKDALQKIDRSNAS